MNDKDNKESRFWDWMDRNAWGVILVAQFALMVVLQLVQTIAR